MTCKKVIDKILGFAKREHVYSQELILEFLDIVEEYLRPFSPFITLENVDRYDSIIIVGDTHGDYQSSLHVLKRDLNNKVVIFLGDYIDRGKMQLENILYLLSKKIQYPDNVHLIRGNHESIIINYMYGFYASLVAKYCDPFHLLVRFNEVLSLLPYSILLDDYRLLLLHGGIARNWRKVEDAKYLPGKDLIPSNQMAFEILWNDPREHVEGFIPSTRGEGAFFYGKDVTEEFMNRNDLKMMVRSHECYRKGFSLNFVREKSLSYLLSVEKLPLAFPVKNPPAYVLTIFTCRYYETTPTVAIVKRGELKITRLNKLKV